MSGAATPPPGFVLDAPPADPVPAPPPGFVLDQPATAAAAPGASDISGIIDSTADRLGVPRALAHGIATQESREGGASPNVMQIIPSTAANPGYGMAPLDPAKINDPQANVEFGLGYLKAKAAAAGAGDLSDPANARLAAMLYNGGGDPNYAQHVAAHMPAGSFQVAQTGDSVATPAASAQAGGSTGDTPPIGLASPNVQAALDQMRQGQAISFAGFASGNQALARLGTGLAQQAGTILQLDSFQPGVRNGMTGQFNTRTGQFTADPDQRQVVNGRLVDPRSGLPVGPQPAYPGSDQSAISNNDLLTLAPKVQNGTASPDELRRYSLALANRFPTKQDVGANGIVTSTPTQPPLGFPAGNTAANVAPLPGDTVAANRQAEAAGTASGDALGKRYGEIVANAREGQLAMNQIDSARAAISQATASGIPTGYFSPALATVAAQAKSLGIDTSALGVKPEAVGNIQQAKESLAQAGGAVLKGIFPGRITNVDIERFIDATPGIINDPQALDKMLQWARAKAQYDVDFGGAANDSVIGNRGTLPPTFEAEFYRKHGYGPTFNPTTHTLDQQGAQPATGQAQQAAPTAAIAVGRTATLANGSKVQWNGTGWVPK